MKWLWIVLALSVLKISWYLFANTFFENKSNQIYSDITNGTLEESDRMSAVPGYNYGNNESAGIAQDMSGPSRQDASSCSSSWNNPHQTISEGEESYSKDIAWQSHNQGGGNSAGSDGGMGGIILPNLTILKNSNSKDEQDENNEQSEVKSASAGHAFFDNPDIIMGGPPPPPEDVPLDDYYGVIFIIGATAGLYKIHCRTINEATA